MQRFNLEITDETFKNMELIQEKLKLKDPGAVLVASVSIVHKMLSGEGAVTLPADKARELGIRND